MKPMTKILPMWRKIFDEISTADEHIVGKINYYNLACILEDLYLENAELKERVEALEKDNREWHHPESVLALNTQEELFND